MGFVRFYLSLSGNALVVHTPTPTWNGKRSECVDWLKSHTVEQRKSKRTISVYHSIFLRQWMWVERIREEKKKSILLLWTHKLILITTIRNNNKWNEERKKNGFDSDSLRSMRRRDPKESTMSKPLDYTALPIMMYGMAFYTNKRTHSSPNIATNYGVSLSLSFFFSLWMIIVRQSYCWSWCARIIG